MRDESVDLAAMFDENDFAVAASWTPSSGGAVQTASVILDAGDDVITMGPTEMMGRHYRITYPATKLVNLDNGEAITVDGEDYIVREVRQIEDGALMEAMLGRYDG